jgi:hypothetical protein
MMFTIRQELASHALPDPVAALDEGLDALAFEERFPGQRIAIAVGSRDADGTAPLVKRLVERLGGAGLEPFIIPSMGSHGGATPEGQTAVLARLGITPGTVGAPVDPSMETMALGATPGGAEAFTAMSAMASDGIVLVNRVAPHTGYAGRVQSGVVKMLAVGLGKADGARALHKHGFGAGHLIGELADLILTRVPPVIAVALAEDGHKKLSSLSVLPGEKMREAEPDILRQAASMWPSIPVGHADLLIVDEIGKDVSGIGMDPLVTGRGKGFLDGDMPSFQAERVVVLRLTGASGGNATGIGHADITTQAFVDATDRAVTYKNVLTSGALHRARIPLVAATDREAVEMALSSLGLASTGRARVVRIRNTRQLEEIEVSESLLESLEKREGIAVQSGPHALFGDSRAG